VKGIDVMARSTAVTILMADDDVDDRDLTQDALRRNQLNGELKWVEDGEELLDYLNHRGRYSDPRASPRPGIILLDLNMPRMDGREALREIKAHPELRQIPIIVLSTSSADEGQPFVHGRWALCARTIEGDVVGLELFDLVSEPPPQRGGLAKLQRGITNLQQTGRFRGIGKRTYEESIDEMKHADRLIERILFLDGLPNLQRLGRIRVGENVPEMLDADIALESDAIPRLNVAIALCVQHADNGTRALLEDILVSEEEHLDWLETQKKLIATISLPEYLSQQIHA
jgi:bacterioferritin